MAGEGLAYSGLLTTLVSYQKIWSQSARRTEAPVTIATRVAIVAPGFILRLWNVGKVVLPSWI